MIFQYKHTSFDDSVMVWLKSCRKYKVFFPITQNLSKKKTIFPNIILKTSNIRIGFNQKKGSFC